MTPVGFVLGGANTTWLGGLSYFGNLFAALRAAPDPSIEPHIFCDTAAKIPAEWGGRIFRSRMLDAWSAAFVARGAVNRLTGLDLLLERRFLAEGVAAISHSDVGRLRRLPTLPWIPDVQHRGLPQYFATAERAVRDRTYGRLARNGTLVLASSECARRDIEEHYPAARGRVRVLRFVHCALAPDPAGPGGVTTRHGIEGPFVLLPNQFWIHKNHGVVVDALRILRRRGRRALVVCTGSTQDHRQPGYFAQLEARIREAGVAADLRILGVVPYADLHGLMTQAVAILNPSLFEGWSTSVEEAKTLGKRVILSAIPVHREQAPERGTFFEPGDAEALATALDQSIEGYDPEEERRCAARALAALPARRDEFARTYAAFVHEALALGPRAA